VIRKFLDRSLFLWLLLCAASIPLLAQSDAEHRTVNLPSSKQLTLPVAGHLGSTNSFPATIAISPDGKYAALLNDGYGTQESLAHQSIAVLDLATNKITDFPDARFSEISHQSYFVGLGFSSDGKRVYASVGSLTDPTGAKSGDTGNGIAVYRFSAGKVAPEKFLPIPLQPLSSGKNLPVGLIAPAHKSIPYPAGFAVIPDTGVDKLLVANNLADNVVLLDAATGKVLQTFDLSTQDLVPSAYPYSVVATKDGRRAWCSLWNSSEVAELDLTGGKVSRRIKLKEPDDPLAPGSHPTAMLLSPSEKTLYVALSNIDQIAEVSTDSGIAFGFRTISMPDQIAYGSVPVALAQSGDGKRLFAAASSLDAVAVFDVAKAMDGQKAKIEKNALMGLIPTEWYPSALAVQGDDLLIATAKGTGAKPNNGMGNVASEKKHRDHPYIPTLIRGSIARVNITETINNLPQLSKAVASDNLFDKDPGTITFASGQNPIKHVIYVLKENRTYDQVLGDLKVGNGDSSLTLYGEDITPNEHKLALQFGVLDNFYDSGEVSGDGHIWSTAAITSDYNEKNWPIAYRGKERTYDSQGQVSDDFPLDHNMPDVDDPGTGYLWDNLARNHVSFRIYGEFVNAIWCNDAIKAANPKEGTPSGQESKCPRTDVKQGGTLPPNVGNPRGGRSPWPWPVPLFSGVKPTKAALRDHFDPLYPDFNTDYPDQLRADEFLNEFGSFVKARESQEGEQYQLPSFVLLYLPDDHTGGTRPNYARPAANVADNDLALGRIVDAVSHSPYWEDTAIFVLEDDAQDGADHVDAHRSVGLVISKYSSSSSEKPYVEHRFYTTVNMVHTMELLLGLPPMNQNDAYAPVMSGLFTGQGDQQPYKADYRNLNNGLIYETNKHDAPGAKISSRMDFSKPDAAGAERLNRVLWKDRKGSATMPESKHTVIPESGD
jgi:DNA-binding beta-propeller fold protein YncE